MAMPLRQSVKVATYLFEQKLRKRDKFPLIVELEPLFACNLKCEGCGKIQHPAGVLKQRMPVAQAVGAVLESGAPMVSIAGGEPLMHPQIDEIVRQLVAKKKYVFLCTNAMLMRKKMEKFTPSPYFAFAVHIDGMRERHDESVAKEGVFDEAVEAIKEAKRRGFRVTTNSTFFNTDTPQTIIEVLDFLNDDLKVDEMMLSPAYAYEKAPDQEHFLGVEQTRELFKKAFAGGDTGAVESALRRAKRFHGPVLVHCLTEKGRGYEPALADEADRFHTVGVMDPLTCEPLAPSNGPSWTSVFGDEIVRIGAEREDVVAITAAMLGPVGLSGFAEAYPDRVWDVGIAEQHAVVSAAGLATGGLHPVVAVYATFLNRAFDQVLMDVALHRCGVTFVLDRAGVTGVDGASHNGMWDLSVLQVVPGLRIAAPRDADQLRAQLREAVAVDDAPTLVRFPKESVGPAIPAVDRLGGLDVLLGDADAEVLLVAVGVMAPVCLQAAGLLRERGLGCTVVDPRWVKPVDPGLPGLAARHRVVAVVEDNSRSAGVGSAVALALGDAEVDVPVRRFGIPEQFLPHAKRGEVLADLGLTPVEIAGRISATLAAAPEAARQGPGKEYSA
ncbi:1-deoxy-D-xylulose-5-phosphate synthase [Streptomyces alboniger]